MENNAEPANEWYEDDPELDPQHEQEKPPVMEEDDLPPDLEAEPLGRQGAPVERIDPTDELMFNYGRQLAMAVKRMGDASDVDEFLKLSQWAISISNGIHTVRTGGLAYAQPQHPPGVEPVQTAVTEVSQQPQPQDGIIANVDEPEGSTFGLEAAIRQKMGLGGLQ